MINKCNQGEARPEIDVGPAMEPDKGGSVTYFYFPNDGFWAIQFGIVLLVVLFAFREFVNDKPSISVLIIFLGILLVIIRLRLKIRSPKWVLVDSEKKTLALKRRWPNRLIVEIDIKDLTRVEVYVQRFRRFPYTVG